MMQRTFTTRLSRDPTRDKLLEAYADLFGRAERTLFARLRAGAPLAATKRAFLVRFGLTARQFNALASTRRGKIASITESRSRLIKLLERRIARARQVLAQTPVGTDKYHQKHRRLAILIQRLASLKADDAAGSVRLCFGSRKLFRRQFALKANGHASHDAWCREWRAARSNQFFVLGSKDETAGCEGCAATVAADGALILRLRLPNALAAGGRHLVIPSLRFAYGHEAIVSSLRRNLSPDKRDWEAVSWRFVRDRKSWRVLATVLVAPGERLSVEGIGVVAIDLNADHVAATDLDRFGNPIGSFRVQCATLGKTHSQAAAIIGDAVAQVVTYAGGRHKPLVAETLDFEAKKAAVEQRGVRYTRIVSALAYGTFSAILQARCYDAGIALRRVNPAFTSVIGAHKFTDRCGLSRHHAAALSIGRRTMHLAERPNRRMGDHVAFPLPVRNRGKHVWAFWREVGRQEAAHRARGTAGVAPRSSLAPTPGKVRGKAPRAIRSSPAGGTPAREPSAALFG